MKKTMILLPEIELISNQARPCSLNIRLSKEERALLDATSKKFDMSISDLARSILIQAMEHMMHDQSE
jgi:hypothetical protein